MTAPIPRDIPELPPIPGVAKRLSPLVPARAVLPLTWRPAAAAFRALVALAAAAGVTVELLTGSPLRALGLWSVQCGVLVAVVFACSAVRAWSARHPLPPLVTGGTLLYAWTAGLLHHLLLTHGVGAFALTGAGTGAGAGDVAALTNWHGATSPLLHTAIPLAVAADWLLLTRPGTLRLVHTATWLLFPLAFLGFTLARGTLLGTLLADDSPTPYLYPFLDVTTYGYKSVLPNILLIGVAISVLALALVTVDHIRPNLLRTGRDTPRGPRGPGDRLSHVASWDQLPENRISSPATSGLE
ncbi:integral membrane regulator [Streptomyces ruber]|uniref:Integral membrane regulator n=2 Tax=Streptomyces TaxID=1883 RepID=A0A918BMG3_9ACTN|nr:Pr6Pr family membrane protein [Streptomyces ruber]GGQ77278.1 integral membrane regulator [Streptomyces ruber]